MNSLLGRVATIFIVSMGLLGSANAAPMTYTVGFSFGSPVTGLGTGTEPGLTGSVTFTYDTDLLPVSGGLQDLAPIDSIDVSLLGQTYTPANTDLMYNTGDNSLRIQTTDAHLGNTLAGYFFQITLVPSSGQSVFVEGPAPGIFATFFCAGTNLLYGRPGTSITSASCSPFDTFSVESEAPVVTSSVPIPGTLAFLGFGLLGLASKRRATRK